MLETVIVVLIILWALGFFGGFVAGNLIHLLLVIALVMVIFRLASGRKIV
jgi:Family of unknown function (DUF5670)